MERGEGEENHGGKKLRKVLNVMKILGTLMEVIVGGGIVVINIKRSGLKI